MLLAGGEAPGLPGTLFGGWPPGTLLLGGWPPGLLCGALGPVFADGICETSTGGADGIDGADGADGIEGVSTDGTDGADGMDGMSIDGIDDTDDDHVSLGPDGDGSGSLGAIGNGPEATAGIADAIAIGAASKAASKARSIPVAIVALRMNCLVVTA
ncbi:MAG: hypothetical protein JO191_01745 [Mycobacteriaceae bacterium]|nr:hypothetical protein [Mycobacteriaceae bacterium]